jgi:hypothetical protein
LLPSLCGYSFKTRPKFTNANLAHLDIALGRVLKLDKMVENTKINEFIIDL